MNALLLPLLIIVSFIAVFFIWQCFMLKRDLIRQTGEIVSLKQRGSEFVANVSHELKTPLTSIKGYTETLKNGAISDPKKSTEFLTRIEENAERLNLLIQDLLDLSRVEQPEVELDLEDFDVWTLLEELKRQFNWKLSQKKQTLVMNTAVDVVRADRRLIDQALGNLISNAIRYCQEGATINVQIGKVMEKGRHRVEFSVKDNGPGIKPEDVGRIFERFYRADKSRDRALGGTGLGLAIVKHIAMSHGGNIRVSSEPGKGSAFFMRIPA